MALENKSTKYVVMVFGTENGKTHRIELNNPRSDTTHRANSTLCPGKNFPFITMLDALRDGEPFFDTGEDYPYIKEVKTLKKLGIIKGDCRSYFHPDGYITWEEAMLIAWRVMRYIKKFRTIKPNNKKKFFNFTLV